MGVNFDDMALSQLMEWVKENRKNAEKRGIMRISYANCEVR